jgi:hypothetical protein
MYLSRTKIYWQEQKYMGARFKTSLCYKETIKWFGQELTDTTYTQNATTIGVVVKNQKNGLPKGSICVFSNK